MDYDKLVKKYEGKRRGIVITSCIIFLIFIIAIAAAAVFIPGFIAENHDTGMLLLMIIPAAAMIFFVGFVLLFLRVFHEFSGIKKVRGDMEKVQQQTGLTDNDMFMEVINSSQKISGMPDLYLSSDYVIDLGGWFGFRTDSITGIELDYTHDNISDDSCINYFVVVTHDGKTNRIFAQSSAQQKKIYRLICDLWQGSAKK